LSNDRLTTKDEIRKHFGEPSHMSVAKELSRLDRHCRDFISLSPFVVIASSNSRGECDASPRGDAPGFVAIIDDTHLLIPDRKGNNRADSMINMAENPHIGLLFLVPGINESLRVSGKVEITLDQALLTPLQAGGRVPTSAMLVTVEKAFFQCGKAGLRSEIWNPDKQVAKGAFPSLGRILADQISGIGDATKLDEGIQDKYKSQLY
jgi:uncharacterized protein